MSTTATIKSSFDTATALFTYTNLDIEVDEDYGFWINFTDVDQAIAQVELAKQKSFNAYVRAGGNPRNKRSYGSQFAAVKKALVAAS